MSENNGTVFFLPAEVLFQNIPFIHFFLNINFSKGQFMFKFGKKNESSKLVFWYEKLTIHKCMVINAF